MNQTPIPIPTQPDIPTVPNRLLRYMAIRVHEYGRRATSEYLRQISKGQRRPTPDLAIVLEDVTGVAKEDWLWADQAQVNEELLANYPVDGRWADVLKEYRGKRV